jgi:hypothetical protein
MGTAFVQSRRRSSSVLSLLHTHLLRRLRFGPTSLQYTPFGKLKYMVGGFRAAQPEFGDSQS